MRLLWKAYLTFQSSMLYCPNTREEHMPPKFGRFLVAAGGLGVSFVVAVVLIEAGHLPTPARAAAALLPAIAMAAFLWVEIAYLRQLDEFHRRVQLEALAVAFPLALLLVFT